MERFEVIQTPNRRMGRMDRRQCVNRRRYPGPATNSADAIINLRAMLDEAHARIRMLERAVETLKKTI
jgi:hypothetical protein